MKRERSVIVVLCFAVVLVFLAAMLFLTGGHPMAPLDDTFIFLQYAKMLSRGFLFEYTQGAGYSTGASSPLYPFLLAPFFWLGLDGVKMIGITFLWGVVFYTGTALLIYTLAREWLPWKSASLVAAFLFILNGNLAWGFLSGMDVGLFAFLILLTLYLFQCWLKQSTSASFRLFLLSLAFTSIARPEGIVIAGITVIFFACLVSLHNLRLRDFFYLFLAAFLLPALYIVITWLLTSSFTTNGMLAKSAPYHPYYTIFDVFRLVAANFNGILAGYYHNIMPDELYRYFTQTLVFPYFPPFALLLFVAGFLYIALNSGQDKLHFAPLFSLLIFLGGMCSLTILQTLFAHSQRYFHPYQPLFLLVMTAGIFWAPSLFKFQQPERFGRILGVLLILASLPSVYFWAAEYGENCNDLYNQHRRMSWWVKDTTSQNAVIGLTDCGLIPYYTDRRTVDFVGLVTNDMARWWRNGIGTTFEKMETLNATWLPDYIITHPAVWGTPNFLGTPVYQTFLLDNTVSLGSVLIAFEQDWSLLNSGVLPSLDHDFELERERAKAKVIDAVDVADLESERAHGYVFLSDPERRNPDVWPYPGNFYQETRYLDTQRVVADGGREISGLETFSLKTIPHQPAILVMRTDASSTVSLSVSVNGQSAGEWTITPVSRPLSANGSQHFWQEPEFFIEKSFIQGDSIDVAIHCRWTHIGTGDIHRSFHYWLLHPFQHPTLSGEIKE